MADSDRYPRVLIVTPGVLNPFKASGVTLSRLLARWPREALAQVHSDVYPEDTSLAGRFYATGGPYRRPGRVGVRRVAQFGAFLTGLGEHGLVWSRMSRRLRRWLRDFRPDVILSETGNLSFVHLTHQIADETGAPIVLHIPDDWVSDWPSGALGVRVPVAGPALAALARREFARLVARAAGLTAISEAMAEVYEQRYGRPWTVVRNGVALDEWPETPPFPGPFDATRPFTILYSGGLVGAVQADGVEAVARGVARLAAAGHPIRLEIATHPAFAHRARTWARPGAVECTDFVEPERLPQRLASADVLLVTGPLDPLHVRYGRLSMPGKVAEYLAAGRPVLVVGHSDLAVVRHARRHGWGEIVTSAEPEEIDAALLRLATDAQRRATLARCGRAVAADEFNVEVMRSRLEAILRAAAS